MATATTAGEPDPTNDNASLPVETSNTSGCLDDPNFATICSFLEQFGPTCGVGKIPFQDLQVMLENTNEGNF